MWLLMHSAWPWTAHALNSIVDDLMARLELREVEGCATIATLLDGERQSRELLLSQTLPSHLHGHLWERARCRRNPEINFSGGLGKCDAIIGIDGAELANVLKARRLAMHGT